MGAAKGWDNEEAMGLDEYNSQTNFISPTKRIKNEYRRVTNDICAPYAGDFIRRKQKSNFPSLDDMNDKEIFAFSLKKVFGYYQLRTCQDDSEIEPKGVYSTENKGVYLILFRALSHRKLFINGMPLILVEPPESVDDYGETNLRSLKAKLYKNSGVFKSKTFDNDLPVTGDILELPPLLELPTEG